MTNFGTGSFGQGVTKYVADEKYDDLTDSQIKILFCNLIGNWIFNTNFFPKIFLCY